MVVAIGAAASGCAAIVDGTTQPIHIETIPVAGADCTLSNGQGQWSVVTPGTVTVKRSASVLKAVCIKQGWSPATAYLTPVQSSTAIAGTLAFSFIETAVDASSGAGNNYPGSYTILMTSSEH